MLSIKVGFPGGTSGKESTCQCRRCKRHGFHPWIRKIPWRRVWQPTPIFLPGESHEQRSLAGYSQTWLKQLSMHTGSKVLKWSRRQGRAIAPFRGGSYSQRSHGQGAEAEDWTEGGRADLQCMRTADRTASQAEQHTPCPAWGRNQCVSATVRKPESGHSWPNLEMIFVNEVIRNLNAQGQTG